MNVADISFNEWQSLNESNIKNVSEALAAYEKKNETPPLP
jgi:hypothetical protein